METLMIDVYSAIPNARRLGFRAWMFRMAEGLGITVTDVVARDIEPCRARIEHGRWIADCLCGGAENVTADDPVMLCFSCGNAHIGGRLMPVAFPEEREQLERLLSERPRQNQNWAEPESIDSLRVDNLAHGMRVD